MALISMEDPNNVPRPARKTHLRLLGSVLEAARSHNGGATIAEVNAIVRNAVQNQGPHVPNGTSF
jgi:hypothetical protein